MSQQTTYRYAMGGDWKNPEAYPSDDEAVAFSMDRWAELFLWRNEDFIKEFTAAAKLPRPEHDENGEPIGWDRTPIGKVLQKWGVEHPRLPEWVHAGVGDSLNVFEKHPLLAHSAEINGTRISWLPRVDGRMVLEFDLTAPLPPQLERAKRLLEMNARHANGDAPKNSRKRLRMYSLYLRVVDAKAAGASDTEIADHFSKEMPDGVSLADVANWINRAEELVSGGYKRLAKMARPK